MRILLGERLRQLREEKDVTQVEVAKYLNCSNKMISGYELNQREPDLATVKRLCDYFGVSSDYLLGRDDHLTFQVPITLTKLQKDLFVLFNQLPIARQEEVLRLMKCYLMAFGET